MKLSEELAWRGFINQTTIKNITDLDDKKISFYHGFDASSDSLTIGNLASLMLDKCFIRHGHKAVLLAGGATSMIGDPGGKDAERVLQSEEIVKNNVAKVRVQIEQLFNNEKVTMVNNLDWYSGMNVLTFLRDVGKHFSMTPLVQRDYIATRMGESGAGISYTEFSYTILQGYDFLYLNEKYGTELQLSGSDQWGNCLSGIDIVRRVTGREVHALTMPLIINKATGKKFGKSEEGAVWLDPKKTSVFKFYQFWLNIDDDGVSDYLKIFTELTKQEIEQTLRDFNQNRAGRLAQKTLAYEVTKLVHGKERTDEVKRVTEVLFGKANYADLHKDDFRVISQELTTVKIKPHDDLISVLVKANLASSNTEARQFLKSGGVYINGKQASSDTTNISLEDALHGYVVLRRGKNNQALLQLA